MDIHSPNYHHSLQRGFESTMAAEDSRVLKLASKRCSTSLYSGHLRGAGSAEGRQTARALFCGEIRNTCLVAWTCDERRSDNRIDRHSWCTVCSHAMRKSKHRRHRSQRCCSWCNHSASHGSQELSLRASHSSMTTTDLSLKLSSCCKIQSWRP